MEEKTTKKKEKLAEAKKGSVDHWWCEADPEVITEGGIVTLGVESNVTGTNLEAYTYDWEVDGGSLDKMDAPEVKWDTTGLVPSRYKAKVTITPTGQGGESKVCETSIIVKVRPVSRDDTITVAMSRAATPETKDQALWVVIRNSLQEISFPKYKEFIDRIMCSTNEGDLSSCPNGKAVGTSSSTPFPFLDAYKWLKVATEVFLMCNCGVLIDFGTLDLHQESRRLGRGVSAEHLQDLWDAYLREVNAEKTLPYLALIRAKLGEIPLKDDEAGFCYGILREKLVNPCFLELIWSYWHEEGMLQQTMNAISLRFQNKRTRAGRDPLAHVDIDPLRPLNNLFWGYLQDEPHRLSLARRAYEYDHHYGMPLYGTAVPTLKPVDSRSKFLEAFHTLLYICSTFYVQDDDTMVIADGFPVLNALREVHLLLAEGAHNQFGDLPSTARMEMLMEQWLLARPEMREFLSSRVMVPYLEPWMDRVDTMKRLQGWTDVSIINFHHLAVFGEQILLSVRYGSWNEVTDREQAANWARYWRGEIQGYIHAYRAVTGVDLTAEITDTRQAAQRYLPPTVHLQKRLAAQMQAR